MRFDRCEIAEILTPVKLLELRLRQAFLELRLVAWHDVRPANADDSSASAGKNMADDYG